MSNVRTARPTRQNRRTIRTVKLIAVLNSAPDEDKAIELAHQVFTVAADGGNENYDQETTYVELDPTGTVEYEYEED